MEITPENKIDRRDRGMFATHPDFPPPARPDPEASSAADPTLEEAKPSLERLRQDRRPGS
jgi:hypothetical protein